MPQFFDTGTVAADQGSAQSTPPFENMLAVGDRHGDCLVEEIKGWLRHMWLYVYMVVSLQKAPKDSSDYKQHL